MRRAGLAVLALALPVATLVAGTAIAAPAIHPSALAPVSEPTPGMPLPKIKGLVAHGRIITVDPEQVSAGQYKLVIRDTGKAHNWHITGPGGVDLATSVPGTGRTIWKVDLVAGSYHIQCDPHSTTMHTELVVT